MRTNKSRIVGLVISALTVALAGGSNAATLDITAQDDGTNTTVSFPGALDLSLLNPFGCGFNGATSSFGSSGIFTSATIEAGAAGTNFNTLFLASAVLGDLLGTFSTSAAISTSGDFVALNWNDLSPTLGKVTLFIDDAVSTTDTDYVFTSSATHAGTLQDIGITEAFSSLDITNFDGTSTGQTLNLTVGDPISPVPLPAAGWMLIGGLAGLAAYGRRKTS